MGNNVPFFYPIPYFPVAWNELDVNRAGRDQTCRLTASEIDGAPRCPSNLSTHVEQA